ncbi:MAG: inorganic diphosphatase, partial [Bacteroidota bacterium]
MKQAFEKIWKMLGLRYKSHPWHGIEIGQDAPKIVASFIEVIPSDTVKYEVDKKSGYLKIDRPQKFSNIVPALYGFIPQTLCKESVAEF